MLNIRDLKIDKTVTIYGQISNVRTFTTKKGLTIIRVTISDKSDSLDLNFFYSKINMRVDKMIDEGLIDEVKNLYDKGINSKAINTGIGYKELYKFFNNEISLSDSIELIKRNSRRYAKRQYTFFNHQFPTIWFQTDYENFNNTVKNVYNYLIGE